MKKTKNQFKLIDLLQASKEGKLDVVKSIVAASPNLVNRRGRAVDGKYMGYTSLLVALYNRHYDIAKFLLENDADPNLRSTGSERVTCLLLAVGGWRHLPTLKLLLAKGANPNTCDESGQYPLMGALDWYKDDPESKKEISLLLKYGADVDYKTSYLVSVRELILRSDDAPKSVRKLLGV
jgi:ankyrin repeat protein